MFVRRMFSPHNLFIREFSLKIPKFLEEEEEEEEEEKEGNYVKEKGRND